jgi:hypothetical protein
MIKETEKNGWDMGVQREYYTSMSGAAIFSTTEKAMTVVVLGMSTGKCNEYQKLAGKRKRCQAYCDRVGQGSSTAKEGPISRRLTHSSNYFNRAASISTGVCKFGEE